jgi:hypothetical protein
LRLRPMGGSGRSSTARAAATSLISSSPSRITDGRSCPTA